MYFWWKPEPDTEQAPGTSCRDTMLQKKFIAALTLTQPQPVPCGCEPDFIAIHPTTNKFFTKTNVALEELTKIQHTSPGDHESFTKLKEIY